MMPGTRDRDAATPAHDALDWNPESTVDGRGYRPGDHERELDRHLPDRWAVTRFAFLEPDEKNHGGKPVLRVTLEHTDADATIRVSPASTLSESGPQVLNTHVVARRVDGETTTVAGKREMVTRERVATILQVVVDVADTFSDRYRLFHGR
jgi:hypothetical protein